jgi:hypothetical protein
MIAGLLSSTDIAQAGKQRPAGVDTEVMLHLQMLVEPLEMGTIQVADPAASLALEQETAAVVALLVAAVLIKGTILRVNFMNPAGGGQLIQLAVNGGQPHGNSLLAQILSEFSCSQGLFLPFFQAAKHSLLLFGAVGHRISLLNMKMIIVFIL